MRLALVQMALRPGEKEWNLAHAAELIQGAAQRGADLVLLPEALPIGWMDPSADEQAVAIPRGPVFRTFAELAARHRIHLCTGLVERAGNTIYNSAVFLSPAGELLLHHRKIHELSIAHGCYGRGDRLAVVQTALGRIGLMICADGFAPGQSIARALCLMGAELILSPCAWAVPPGHNNAEEPYGKLWLDNYGAVTREFGNWIAGCSNVGSIQSGAWTGHNCIGCSMVVGPDGSAKWRCAYGVQAEETLLCDLELKVLVRSCAD